MKDIIAQSIAMHFVMIAAGCVVITAGIHAIAPILNPIFIAILFAVVFEIPRSWLTRRGMSAGLAMTVVVFGSVLITLLLMLFIGGAAMNASASLPAYQQQIQTQLDTLGELLAQFGIQIDQIRTLVRSEDTNPIGILRYAISGVASLLSSAILILVYAIFLLVDSNSFPAKLDEAFKPSEPAYRYLKTVTSNLRSFLATQTLVCLITGVAITLALWLLGIQYALLWGFVAFLMNYIPYIGSILAAVPAIIVAFVQFGPGATILLVIVAYVVVNILVNYAIYPRLMSQGVDLSLFVVMASMFFWGLVLGPIGLILAIPLTAVIKISLESYAGSRWLGIMLGSGPKA